MACESLAGNLRTAVHTARDRAAHRRAAPPARSAPAARA